MEYDTLAKSRAPTKKQGKQPFVKYKAKESSHIAALEGDDIHVIQSGKKSFDSPWKPGNTRYDSCKPPCNYCHDPDHDMKHCGPLRLKYYANHLDVMPHPPGWLGGWKLTTLKKLQPCHAI